MSATERGERLCTLPSMSSVAVEEMIQRAGKALIDAAPAPAKVILFGSHARVDADQGSDFADDAEIDGSAPATEVAGFANACGEGS